MSTNISHSQSIDLDIKQSKTLLDEYEQDLKEPRNLRQHYKTSSDPSLHGPRNEFPKNQSRVRSPEIDDYEKRRLSSSGSTEEDPVEAIKQELEVKEKRERQKKKNRKRGKSEAQKLRRGRSDESETDNDEEIDEEEYARQLAMKSKQKQRKPKSAGAKYYDNIERSKESTGAAHVKQSLQNELAANRDYPPHPPVLAPKKNDSFHQQVTSSNVIDKSPMPPPKEVVSGGRKYEYAADQSIQSEVVPPREKKPKPVQYHNLPFPNGEPSNQESIESSYHSYVPKPPPMQKLVALPKRDSNDDSRDSRVQTQMDQHPQHNEPPKKSLLANPITNEHGSRNYLNEQPRLNQPDPINRVNEQNVYPGKALVPIEGISTSPYKHVPIQEIPHIAQMSTTILPSPLNGPPVELSKEDEPLRLAALYSSGLLDSPQDSRLSKITQMTLRLLGRSCCVISFVDADKVIWKYVSWGGNMISDIKEEPRYESFCSWVVQDNTGRGITILDANNDPRCTHMRVKRNLEFYAGVPLILHGKYKVGALSIQGPPGSQMNLIDMNILHEMSIWASGELDTIVRQRELEYFQKMLDAQAKLGLIAQNIRLQKIEVDQKLVEHALELVLDSFNATSVLLLKLVPEQSGCTIVNLSFKTVLKAYACATNMLKQATLNIGDEMFHELSSLILKREDFSAPFLLQSLKSGAVTRDVDTFLSKKINKCMGEIVWANNAPTAILAAFFEGQHRIISKDDIGFLTAVGPILSTIVEQEELREAFGQSMTLSKVISNALKKNPIQYGTNTGLAPVVAIFSMKLAKIKGNYVIDESLEKYTNKDERRTSHTVGPKGQALAQVLAKQQEIESVLGRTTTENHAQTVPEVKKKIQINPIEYFELERDFNSIADNLAEKYHLKKAKKIGEKHLILANIGPETGTFDNVATFAHELYFALDLYNTNKSKQIEAKIGIHCDFIPADAAGSAHNVKDHFQSILNGAFNLENIADTNLVSETFYHQTKHNCTYESNKLMVLRGHAYQLLGKSEEQQTYVDAPKENDVNKMASMVQSRVPKHGQVAPDPNPQPEAIKNPIEILLPKKSKKCVIL